MIECSNVYVDAQGNELVSPLECETLGLCIFGRSVTDTHPELIVNALNDAHATVLDVSFPKTAGRQVLEMEWAF